MIQRLPHKQKTISSTTTSLGHVVPGPWRLRNLHDGLSSGPQRCQGVTQQHYGVRTLLCQHLGMFMEVRVRNWQDNSKMAMEIHDLLFVGVIIKLKTLQCSCSTSLKLWFSAAVFGWRKYLLLIANHNHNKQLPKSAVDGTGRQQASLASLQPSTECSTQPWSLKHQVSSRTALNSHDNHASWDLWANAQQPMISHFFMSARLILIIYQHLRAAWTTIRSHDHRQRYVRITASS